MVYLSAVACLRSLLLMICLFIYCNAYAAQIDIIQPTLEHSDTDYRLSARYAFTLNRELKDALVHGIPLYFTTDIRFTRRRWYWFNQISLSASRTTRLSYNVLTQQFYVAVQGQLQQSFATLEEALALIHRPVRWIIADKNALQADKTYLIELRMHLDAAQLSKPLQINALNNSDWQLASDWEKWTFQPR